MAFSKNDIRGFVVPTPTPFKHGGTVDEACIRELVDMYHKAGVDSMFVLGSFGNGPALKPEERKRVAEVFLEAANGRVPMMIHVGCVDPQTTAELGVHAREHGADAIGVVGPYYYNDRNDWELAEHFRYVDQAVGLPIMIYNNAEYQSYDLTPERMSKIRDAVPNVFGTKLAAGTTDYIKRYLAIMKQPFSAFIPSDNFPTCIIEGVQLAGTINPPLANWPELGMELMRAFQSGDLLKTVEVHKRVGKFMAVLAPFREHGRGTTCEVLKARGISIEQYPRWPTKPFTDDERTRLREGLAKVGFPVKEKVAAGV